MNQIFKVKNDSCSCDLVRPLSDTSPLYGLRKDTGWFLFHRKLTWYFFSFFEETFDLQPGKGEGDMQVEMISVREIPTLSALTMCFWQRFLKKHGVSEWPMSIYRHDIPGTNAQGTLTVTWMTYLTSSGVEQMHLSVYQISSNGQLKFLDR